LELLGKYLEIENIDILLKNVNRITIPKPYIVDTNSIEPVVLDRANNLYSDLLNA
jgi:hypothetical protein